MRERGRVSAAARAVTVAGLLHPPPAPPGDVTPAEQAQWKAIAAALKPDWFTPETWPLLRAYVETAELCNRLARELHAVEVTDERFSVLLKQKLATGHMLVALATRMRLTQQDRKSTRLNS